MLSFFVSFNKFDTQVNNFFLHNTNKRKLALNNCLNNEPGTATGDSDPTRFDMKLTEKFIIDKGILLFL